MRKMTLAMLALLMTTMVMAQINPQAPMEKDPTVRYGKLDNGLTYYIKHNEKPADRAEYYLFTNVGAIQETPAQNGLAHFLEHMALNGTKNLPGKMMLDYFQIIGAEFGRNINASTGVEQTMYMLNNIPTVREGIIDTSLLILHDYSGFVTNDPAEIDKERGVIVEEWRTRRNARWRTMEKSWEYLYQGSKYATCNIIGTKEGLETFPAEELQAFYKTWYRPDLQAVAIVGDVDVDMIEAKLKTLFADIPARENAQPKEIHSIPVNEKPIVGIITDPEATGTEITLYVKSDPLPREYRSLGMGYFVNLIQDVINAILRERLGDIARQADAPFLGAEMGFYSVNTVMDAFVIGATTKDSEALKGFEAVMKEFEKAKRFGFSDAELERVKANMIARAERATANAGSRSNAEFINGFYGDFFQGWPYMDPAYEEAQLKGYLNILTTRQINGILAQLPLDKNLVFLYSAPEKEGLSHPTETQIIETFQMAQKADIQANAEEEVAKELVNAKKLKGSKVKKTEAGPFNSTVWTLKNGIKIYVRPSDVNKEEVLFSLNVKGGTSLATEEEIASTDENFIALYNSLSGLSEFSQGNLQKMLSGKIVSASPSIGNIYNGVNASCNPKEIETMLQLVYLTVCEPRFVEEELAPAMAQLNAIVPNLETQPDYAFQKMFMDVAYNNPRISLISSEKMGKMCFKHLENLYRRIYGNMANAEVVITGNVDLNTLKPLVEKYIGSLPVNKKAQEYTDHQLTIVPGKVNTSFEFPMSTAKCSNLLCFSGDAPYTPENEILAEAFSYILNLIYTETVREDAGGTYGVGAYASTTSRPHERINLLIQFDTDPARNDEMIQLIFDGLEGLAKNGPTPNQMTMTKENLAKNIPENRISNRYWADCLREFHRLGIDLDSQKEAIIDGLTAKKIQAYAKMLLDQNNQLTVTMKPAK